MKPSLLLIGLGNPGKNYSSTRHNTGFQAIDALASTFGEGEWKESEKFLSMIEEGRIVTAPILLVKPQTFMNRSGEAIQKLVEFYKLDPKEQILVLCDDIDLPLGECRFRKSGGPGTHNGLKSVVEHFGEEFPRLRIGIGSQPAGADLATWVLSAQTKEETDILGKTFQTLPDIVKEFVLGSEK